MTTRAQTSLFLLGSVESTILGSMLPSRKQVLRYFMYLHIEQNTTIKEAATETVKLVGTFWDRARIPMQKTQRAKEKVIRLYDDWKALKKNKGRRTKTQENKEDCFLHSIDRLFDIAHEDAMSMITIAEDRAFLLAQREEVRRGTISTTIDVLQSRQEEKKETKRAKQTRQQQRSESQKCQLSEVVELASSSSSSSSSPARSRSPRGESVVAAGTHSSDTSYDFRRNRGSTKLLTPQLSAAMDRSKVTNREAVHILSAAAKSLGHDPKELVLNRESFRRKRMEFRAEAAREIKTSFRPSVPLVVHWDGKIMPIAEGAVEKVDRLPVMVTGDGVAKLLAVPRLPNGTGQAIADSVITALEDWELTDRVCALSFDTTASNSGLSSGACSLIEKHLERSVLHLACRHHVLELVCGAAFTECLGHSSGPDISIFKRFQSKWEYLDRSALRPLTVEDMPDHLSVNRDALITKFNEILEQHQPRDDYRELLELSIILLGGHPPRGVRILRPGALHQARWMAKIIYSMKIYLLRHQSQFHLTAKEETGIRRFVIFSISTYVESWFHSTSSAAAPKRDLQLLKALVSYSDTPVATVTTKVFGRHLWYLNERLVALAFFDESICPEVKRAMVTSLSENEGCDDPPRRAKFDVVIDDIDNKTIASFVTTTTKSFFEILRLDSSFLSLDPTRWSLDPCYKAAVACVETLSTVNDFAERGVALMQKFNLVLTKNEDQRQFLLQVVEQHRKNYPDSRKSTVSSDVNQF